MHALAMLWSSVGAPATGLPFLRHSENPAWRHYGARADSAAITHLDLSRAPDFTGYSAILACEEPHPLGGASRCAVALSGRLDNEAALRRRLMASGSVGPNASASALVRRLFELYLAQYRDGEKLVAAVTEHLRGDYALLALAPTSEGPLLAGLQHGAPLWLYRDDNAVRLSTRRLNQARSDATRLEAGDLVLAYPDRVAIVDTEGMRIEKRLRAPVLAQLSADDARQSALI
jgi:glucosamine 6-phosphate synthetase-like amidotransferase/phosphosugar isomerase protein